ncbi:MAG: 1-acyl-sn-glycerol-3-phosphate acyltransferase [Alphaproteobacteria bacterium]|nr:1-acyl-sn-glycerol-3-phosphate acyltransferase [Alphaproteobacteria bacterium]
MGRLRFWLRTAGIVGGLLVCVPLHYLWVLFGDSPWPRFFLGWVGRAAGVRIRIVGAPLKRDVLFVSNHTSWLDIMILAGTTGTAFVAKGEVARWPVAGWLAKLNRTVFIARAQRSTVKDQADALRSALASGRPIALFPEGTTDGGHEVLPFRASLLAALFPPLPRLRVQPVAIAFDRTARDIAWIGEEGAGDNARRVLSRPGTIPVSVRFLAPVDPAAAGDRKMLAEQARAEIVESLEAFEAGDDRL